MKTYKDFYTWSQAKRMLKDKMPKGLYKMWDEIEPIGVLEWGNNDLFEVCDNSYNWLDNDNNNIVYQIGYTNKDIFQNKIVAVSFHLGGDVRGNYTDYFLFKFDDVENLLYGFEDEEWKNMGGDVE